MKILNIFAAALVALGIAFSADAQAAAINDTNLGVAVSAGTYPAVPEHLIVDASNSGYTNNTFTEEGTLAAHTKVTYTFTAMNVVYDPAQYSGFYVEGNTGTLGSVQQNMPLFVSPQTSFAVGGIPVFLQAYYNPISSSLGTLVGQIVLTNVTGGLQDIKAFFSATFFQASGYTKVTAVTSAVPIPAAFFLFASGLAALGGAAVRKKNKAA
jgi:hypothetical protein